MSGRRFSGRRPPAAAGWAGRAPHRQGSARRWLLRVPGKRPVAVTLPREPGRRGCGRIARGARGRSAVTTVGPGPSETPLQAPGSQACVRVAPFLDARLPPCRPPAPGRLPERRGGVWCGASALWETLGLRSPLPAFAWLCVRLPAPPARTAAQRWPGQPRALRASPAPPAAGPGAAAPACFLSADAAAAVDQPLSSSARPEESEAAPSACGFAINLYLSASAS